MEMNSSRVSRLYQPFKSGYHHYKGGDALHLAALDKLAKRVDFDLQFEQV